MKFLILLYADESQFAKLSPEEMNAAMASFASYNAKLAEAGVLAHGEPIRPSHETKTLRMEKGKPVTLDGPFAETKEQLGGYYVLDVKDEAEAVHWASQCPVLYSGVVEVRGLMGRPG